MNYDRLIKLITSANHQSHADAERMMAAKAVCKMLAGEDVQRLFGANSANYAMMAQLQAARDEIRRLKEAAQEHEAATFKAQRAAEKARERAKQDRQAAKKLAREVETLRAELAKANAQPTEPASGDHVPWVEVEIAITKATDGHVSGLGMTALHLGIPIKVLFAWRTVGQLPRHLFVKIASMKPGQKPSRARWSLDEQTMLRRLARLEPVKIARRIGAKVGRLILESSVIRMARILEVKLGTGAAGSPQPQRRRPAGRATSANTKPQAPTASARPARRAA